jgi:hypothetical protein
MQQTESRDIRIMIVTGIAAKLDVIRSFILPYRLARSDNSRNI